MIGVLPNPPTTKWRCPPLRARTGEVVACVWSAIHPLIPVLTDTHPLGRHRGRKSDFECFKVTLVRLVTGCSWEDAERLCGGKVSDTTVRDRRDEWIQAGVFPALMAEVPEAYNRSSGSPFLTFRSTAPCTRGLVVVRE